VGVTNSDSLASLPHHCFDYRQKSFISFSSHVKFKNFFIFVIDTLAKEARVFEAGKPF
jgi:hypothetical protein